MYQQVGNPLPTWVWPWAYPSALNGRNPGRHHHTTHQMHPKNNNPRLRPSPATLNISQRACNARNVRSGALSMHTPRAQNNSLKFTCATQPAAAQPAQQPAPDRFKTLQNFNTPAQPYEAWRGADNMSRPHTGSKRPTNTTRGPHMASRTGNACTPTHEPSAPMLPKRIPHPPSQAGTERGCFWSFWYRFCQYFAPPSVHQRDVRCGMAHGRPRMGPGHGAHDNGTRVHAYVTLRTLERPSLAAGARRRSVITNIHMFMWPHSSMAEGSYQQARPTGAPGACHVRCMLHVVWCSYTSPWRRRNYTSRGDPRPRQHAALRSLRQSQGCKMSRGGEVHGGGL